MLWKEGKEERCAVGAPDGGAMIKCRLDEAKLSLLHLESPVPRN